MINLPVHQPAASDMAILRGQVNHAQMMILRLAKRWRLTIDDWRYVTFALVGAVFTQLVAI